MIYKCFVLWVKTSPKSPASGRSFSWLCWRYHLSEIPLNLLKNSFFELKKHAGKGSLSINASKTKYIFISIHPCAIDWSPLMTSELIVFKILKYLGGYVDSGHDMNTRIGQSWRALNSLNMIWKSPIRKR